MEKVQQACSKIRVLLDKAVERNLTDGILLSGGLDTSILALVTSKYANLSAFTVAFKPAEAPDIQYAQLIANKLKLDHRIYYFDEDEVYSAIHSVIKTLRLFDPMEVRNSVAIFIGMQVAMRSGTKSVMTGDALDELFAGYSWLFHLSEDELRKRLSDMWKTMMFSSIPIAQSLNMEAKAPFLDPGFKSYAEMVDTDLKIRVEKGEKHGKWIMRKAFEGLIPDEIVWRVKTPIEFGTGTTIFPKFFEEKLSNSYFKQRKEEYLKTEEVALRDKEQLFNYEIFRSLFGSPNTLFAEVEGKECPQCKARIKDGSSFCRICGAYPI